MITKWIKLQSWPIPLCFCKNSFDHELASISHELNNMVESSHVNTQVDSGAHEIHIVDSRHKGHDFVHHTIKDVKRTKYICMGGHKNLRRPSYLLPKQENTYKRSTKDAIS